MIRFPVSLFAGTLLTLCLPLASLAVQPPPPKPLSERVQQATHVFVGTATDLAVLDEAGKRITARGDEQPASLGLGQSIELSVQVEQSIFPAGWKPEGKIKVRYGGGFFSVKDLREALVEKKLVYLTKQKDEEGDSFFVESYPWSLTEGLDKKAEIESILKIAKVPEPEILRRRMKIDMQHASITDLLSFLGEVAGLKYEAPAEVSKLAKPVTISGQKTIRKILDEACAQAEVAYEATPAGKITLKERTNAEGNAVPSGTPSPESAQKRAEALLALLRAGQWDQAAPFVIRNDEETDRQMGIPKGATPEQANWKRAEWFTKLYSQPKPGPIRSVKIDPNDKFLAQVSYTHEDLDAFHMRFVDEDWYYTLQWKPKPSSVEGERKD